MRGSKQFFLVVFSLFMLMAAGAAQATDYYMSPSGSDSNDGKSVDKPWKTLDRLKDAQSTLKAGDVVYFMGGEYVITDSAKYSYYPLTADGITYKNYNGENSVIIHDRMDVDPNSESDRGTFSVGGDDIVFEGLNFRQSDRSRAVTMVNHIPLLPNPKGGFFMISGFRIYGSGVKFRKCSITNYSGTGIFPGSNTLIENCHLETGGHALYMAHNNSTVRFNSFDCSRGHKGQRCIQIQYEPSKNNMVYGNVIVGGQASGIVFSGPVSGNQVFNNVFGAVVD